MPIKDESQAETAGHQHPIPQNVMDVEFKVVGDLTVRQLMYLFAGGVFAYIIFRSELPGFWRYIISFISVVGTVAIAFVPFEERGLDKWVMSFIKAMTTPTQMVWRKTYSPPAYFLSDYANIIKNEILTLTPAKSRNKLDDYLGQLSESQNDLDRIETTRLQNIRMGFSNQSNTDVVLQQTTVQSYSPSLGTTTTTETDVTFIDNTEAPGRTISEPGETETPLERQPLREETPEPREQEKQKSFSPAPLPPPAPTPTQQTSQSKPAQVTQTAQSTQTPQQQVQPAQKPVPPTPQIQTNQQNQKQTQLVQQNKPGLPVLQQQNQQSGRQQLQTQPKPQLIRPITEKPHPNIKEMVNDEISSKTEFLNSIEFKKPTLAAPSIDRAIINIPSNPRGEIKIKTTTTIPKTIVVQDIKELETKESSLEKKVGELLEVTKQVRSEMQGAADKAAHINKNQSRIDFFNTKYQELEKEQAKITSQLDVSTNQVQQIAPTGGTDLNKQVADLSVKNEELKTQLLQIQQEIGMLKTAAPQTQSQPQIQVQPQAITPEVQQSTFDSGTPQAPSLGVEMTSDRRSKAASPPSQNSNIILGIVKNKNGEIIDNAVVIIKDKDGDAIRALKTNQLGQFKTQTPMLNGKYTVEVIKGGMKFDIISVEARGEVISPLYIVAFE